MTERHFVQFNDDFDGSVDPSAIYEAKANTERDAASDLYLGSECKYTNVPNELLTAIEGTPLHILELGREILVFNNPETPSKSRLGVGTQLIIVQVNNYPRMWLCQADPAWPTFWLGRNALDRHYEAPLKERKIVIVQK